MQIYPAQLRPSPLS